MRTIHIIYLIASILFFGSCKYDEATITVINKVHSVKLESVSFDNHSVGSSLLPGEKVSQELSEHDSNVDFPITAPIKFYMVNGSSKVLLYTKKSFTLKAKDNLLIEITDDTEVINPLNESASDLRIGELHLLK